MNGLSCLGVAALAFAGLSADAARVYPGFDGPTFVREWLVSGPWPSVQKDGKRLGLSTDFLDGENDVAPRPGDRLTSVFVADKATLIAEVGARNEWGFKDDRSFDASWKVRTFETGRCMADGLFSPIDDYFAFYACVYVDVPAETDAVIALGADDCHRVWLDRTELGGDESGRGVRKRDFRYPVKLTKGVHRILVKVVDLTNDCGLCLEVMSANGEALPGLRFLTDPTGLDLVVDAEKRVAYAPDRLAAADVALRARLDRAKTANATLKGELAAAKADFRSAREAYRAAIDATERRLQAAHAAAAARAPKSVDLPLEIRTTRRRLCLNGVWEGRLAKKGAPWRPTPVPTPVFGGKYFIASTYPVADLGLRKFGPHPDFPDFTVPEVAYENGGRVEFRTTFDWDGRGAAEFVAEAIVGVCEVVVNGVSCGSRDTFAGGFRLPLRGLKAGRNELLLKYAHSPHEISRARGIKGDVFVDYVPEVRVTDVFTRSSWERARLEAVAEVFNGSSATVEATVARFVAEGDRVRLTLPETRVTIAAGETVRTDAASGWADPKPWGIGGPWGEPDLYDLVTEVRVGGVTVDRHVQRFGFREFRVIGTQFFLNGRRIRLNGDTGTAGIAEPHRGEIVLDLLRRDGIDTIRTHDGDSWSAAALDVGDRVGMLFVAQNYPALHEPDFRRPSSTNFQSAAEFFRTPTHAWNRANYANWLRAFRNHPCVVVWSTDNEVMSQSKDTDERAPLSLRDDRIAASNEKYLKELEPTLVLTRDGDCGTWGRLARWHEEPPCDTANYHYPDFNPETKVYNWMRTWDWRPVIYGETLYWAYGAWDKWVGATPEKVAAKAARVRKFARLYRDWEVSGQIYMGLSHDGFTKLAADGSGNPLGLGGTKPTESRWYAVDWPAFSGGGWRQPAGSIRVGYNGNSAINWWDPSKPTHIRNAVNEAYRETLEPRPPLRNGSDAEIVIVAAPGADVWAENRATGVTVGVRADAAGRAWFRSLDPGEWRFTSGGRTKAERLSARGASALKAGFADVRKVAL